MALIKSIIVNLPICYISLFKMPKGVMSEFEKFNANFGGETDEKRKLRLMD